MLTRHERGHVTWIDLESPTREELGSVMREFSIDPEVEEEIITPTPYPLQIAGNDYLYLVLHFPTTDPEGGAKNQEIDFIIGKQFLITARYEVIESLHGLHRIFEAEELLNISIKDPSADVLLERSLQHLYGALMEEIQTISGRLDSIERDIFSGKERQTVRKISEVGRVLLRFDTTLARHQELLPSFLGELARREFFGKHFASRIAHIEAAREHVASLVHSYRQVAAELRVTNDSLLSSSQNEVMKTLTVITFTILPSSLVVALFQMNVDGVPFQNYPGAFWIILFVIGCVSGSLGLFAKRKGWL